MTTTKAKTSKAGGISDEAVRKGTGKGWAEWIAILDAAGGAKMIHKDIAAWLHRNHIESGWWSQMVTVGYEQERGLREKHEKPQGYEISVSRTFAVPVGRAFTACHDPKKRKRWLDEKGLVIRKATPNHSHRIMWSDGKTNVSISYLQKSKEKCQVVAQHSKLANAKAAATMKKFWAAALDRLGEVLEE